jgi:hypothetical protein
MQISRLDDCTGQSIIGSDQDINLLGLVAAGILVINAGDDIRALQVEILRLLLGLGRYLTAVRTGICLLDSGIPRAFNASSDANH